jgi:RNA polymerase-binding transcription factor DksA
MDAARAGELLDAEPRRIERGLSRTAHEDDGKRRLDEEVRARPAAVKREEQRLVDGGFGLSIESDEPIPDGRLEAPPTAERTSEDERARRNP